MIIRGIGGIRIVDDEQDRREFVRRLGELAVDTATPIYAWALLDNHAHLLLAAEVWDWRNLCGGF